jgi:hypothetical protein
VPPNKPQVETMIRISDRDYNMKERREAEGRALAPEGRDERLGTQYGQHGRKAWPPEYRQHGRIAKQVSRTALALYCQQVSAREEHRDMELMTGEGVEFPLHPLSYHQ